MSFLPSLASGFQNISSVGSIVSGVGTVMQGRQEQQSGERNAEILRGQAESERVSSNLLEQQKRRNLKSFTGSQVATVAGNGLRFSGSPIDVILDSSTNANLDIAIDNYNSKVQANRFEDQSKSASAQGYGQSSMTFARAGSSFLSLASDLYKNKLGA